MKSQTCLFVVTFLLVAIIGKTSKTINQRTYQMLLIQNSFFCYWLMFGHELKFKETTLHFILLTNVGLSSGWVNNAQSQQSNIQ